MSRIRGPYVRFCERDEAVTPHPTRCVCCFALNIIYSYRNHHLFGMLIVNIYLEQELIQS